MTDSQISPTADPPESSGTTREETAAESAPARRRLSWKKKIVFSVILATLVLGGAEAVLWLTGSPLSRPLLTNPEAQPSAYPAENADEYIKIAAFGGSAAAGAYSWRRFDEIVGYELRKRFPEQKFYVRSYAQSGYPFHRHQAEHLKLLIEKYDIFLIYCGNNEAENWFDDSGYWRHPEYKEARDLKFRAPQDAVPSHADFSSLESLRRSLGESSRLYSLIESAMKSTVPMNAPISKNIDFDYDEFEEADSIPPRERERIVENFGADLAEICQLAVEHDKQVLVATAAGFETWPPCFSFFRPGLTDAEKVAWMQDYEAGLAALQDGDDEAAIEAFQRAAAIDDGVAILNFRIGNLYLKQGRSKAARKFLLRAIDRDGYYSRSISGLHDKAREVAAGCDRLHHVDVVSAFHTVMEGPISDDDLFTDICHPGFLGHVIMGRVFLDELLQLEPFRSWETPPQLSIRETDWQALADEYFAELGITAEEQAFQAATHIGWYFNMAHWTAYRELCYTEIEKLIAHYEEKHDGSPANRVFALASKARLAVVRRELDQAVSFLNEALKLSAAELESAMNQGAWSHYVWQEFDDAGIRYSEQSDRFERMVD